MKTKLKLYFLRKNATLKAALFPVFTWLKFGLG